MSAASVHVTLSDTNPTLYTDWYINQYGTGVTPDSCGGLRHPAFRPVTLPVPPGDPTKFMDDYELTNLSRAAGSTKVVITYADATLTLTNKPWMSENDLGLFHFKLLDP